MARPQTRMTTCGRQGRKTARISEFCGKPIRDLSRQELIEALNTSERLRIADSERASRQMRVPLPTSERPRKPDPIGSTFDAIEGGLESLGDFLFGK
jgi:hypothetical protein